MNATTYFKRGMEYAEKGDFNQAVKELTEAIRIKPDFIDALYNRGRIRSETQDYNDALADFDEVLRLNPEHSAATKARQATIDAKKKAGANSDADMPIRRENLTIDDYTKMINSEPNNDNLYLDRGILYDGNGNSDKAKEDFTKAIQLNPLCFGAYNNRAIIYRNEKCYDLALTDYTMSIELNPFAVQSYINRGIVYAEIGDYKSAIEDYSRAIKLNPRDYEVYLARWMAYNTMGEEKLAEADLKEAFKIEPLVTEQWLQRYMNPPLDPDSAEAHIQNGLESYASGEYDIAIAETTAAIKIGSQDIAAYNGRGMAHIGKGNKALTLGMVAAAQDEYALAIADFKNVLKLDPADKDAKIHSNLGTVYHRLQQYDTAIEYLTWAIDQLSKASSLNADDTKTFSNSLYYRGRSYMATRNCLAKKDFEKILAINPNDGEVRQMLMQVSAWI